MKTDIILDRAKFTTPEDLSKEIGCSPRYMRALISKIGAGRKFGRQIVLLAEDVELLLEASKMRPRENHLLNQIQAERQLQRGDAALDELRRLDQEAKRRKAWERLPPSERHPSGDPDMRPGESLRQIRARMARERQEKLAKRKSGRRA